MALSPDTKEKVYSGFAMSPQQLMDWADDGRFALNDLLDRSHAPAEVRVMRGYTQAEVLETLGGKHERALREFVKTEVEPRQRAAESGSNPPRRTLLTVEDVYEFMRREDLLPTRPGGSRTVRMMIGAYKGGSCKSSLTLHLVHYFASRMYRVLVIDSDPQATLTKAFGLMPERVLEEATLRPVFEAVAEGAEVPAVTFKDTHLPTVKITPANLQLMAADIALATAFQSGRGAEFHRALGRALDQVEDQFDIVLIDTPPAFSMTSVAIVWAANALLLPMPAAVPDFAATFDFCEMVGDLCSHIEDISGEKKVWEPVVVVHSKVENNKTADDVRALSGELFGNNRIEEYVPATSAVNNSFGEFKSVFEMTKGKVDSRSLTRAREAYGAIGQRLERMFTDIWQRQAEVGGA